MSADKDKYIFMGNGGEDDSSEDQEHYDLDLPMSEDYDDYLSRINSGEATDKEHEEFDLRMLLHFIGSVQSGQQPKQWVMLAMADALFKVIMGGRWEDEIWLPWTKVSLPGTKTQHLHLQWYCEIENEIKDNPSENITSIIERVADRHCKAFSTVRDAYYPLKSFLDLQANNTKD